MFEAIMLNSKETMEACLVVEKEIEKVLTKFSGISEHCKRVLNDLIIQVQGLKEELEAAPPDHILTPLQIYLIKQTITKVKDTVSHLTVNHRDLHGTVSKVGKAIDRNFVADFTATSRNDIFNGADKTHLINQVIYQHFCRQGLHDVAEQLAEDTAIKSEVQSKEPFAELNQILDCLKDKDLQLALAWTAVHHKELEAQNSSLEFKLHRLKFIAILKKGLAYQSEAILYARTYFGKFIFRHEKDIQTLMGMLLFVPHGFDNTRYSCMFDNEMWIDIYETFTRDACQLLGVCFESPLAICVNAGCTAVPALLNIKQVMMQRQVSGIWNGKDELPIEIDLGTDKHYHSMFACPILRQQSTESNPPMRLICGHVISRDALNKLCNGNKMKCPYCPMEQSPNDARLIFF